MWKALTASLPFWVSIGSVVAVPASFGSNSMNELRFEKRTTTYVTTPSCTDFWLGQGEKARSRVCTSIVGGDLVVSFKDVEDYDYDEVHLWLGCAAPTKSSPGQLGKALAKYCVIAANKQTATCTVPLTVVPTCGTEPCNNKLFIATHGALTGPSDETGWGMGHCINGGSLPASHVPLCEQGNWAQYWDFTITCNGVPPEEPKTWCNLGTGFGYISSADSPQLDSLSQPPKQCNRWGWYIPATISALASPINGKLIVGAGNNDVSKGTDVGTFSISLSNGVPTVQYALTPTYDLSEAHIYAACEVKPSNCAPGGYTYNSGVLAGNDDQSLVHPFPSLSSCTGTIYFILHGTVSRESLPGAICPPPAV